MPQKVKNQAIVIKISQSFEIFASQVYAPCINIKIPKKYGICDRIRENGHEICHSS